MPTPLSRAAGEGGVVAPCLVRPFTRLPCGAGAAPHSVAVTVRTSIAEHVQAMLAFHHMGVSTLDYGNNIRQVAKDEGVANAFAFPGFVPAYIRPLSCRGIGPFRWAALSGNPEYVSRTDAKVKELLSGHAHLHHWLDMARSRIRFQGLPARICWVGLGERHLIRPRFLFRVQPNSRGRASHSSWH